MASSTPSSAAGETAPSGLAPAISAYLIWGFLPLYLMLVKSIPAFEFVGWRIIWTLPLCLAIVAFRRQFGELISALRSPRSMIALLASSVLIAINWFVYIWAIMASEVYATSIGYYLNPLINVLLGTLVLGEKLSHRQWLAVSIAAIAVALLAAGAVTSLWISLSLGFSFALYGLVRKQVSVGSLPGLTIESAILLPVAGGIAAWYAAGPQGSAFGQDWWMSLLIVFSGVVTAVPLLLFALAARRMDYSTLGFIQYLSPTIVFFLGLFVFHQPLAPAKLVSFVLIWVAVGIFVWDLWAKRKAVSA
ncbi:MAG: EamA family transporter RarD [Erythrobacter sp.]|jgi:chloramphenicol-sensitive protein RarD|uniref:EamA family transporter RarD n=1 Tax=Erythrobacter sp. TaxID=1042 RepID=UPI002B475289|nr:EamA family transporter RarD [Erythrobacter sp.]WRH70538.1 MAG: EamA family transporter RarD [Erythrobacter sp.]